MKTCMTDGCESSQKAQGYCNACYIRLKRANKLAVRFPNIHGNRKTSTGQNHYRWNGGRKVDKNGYISIRVGNDQYQYEHRLIMEKILERELKSWEVVHHKDENKHNNKRSNLELMTIWQHGEHHGGKYPKGENGKWVAQDDGKNMDNHKD